ncbi:uncharacterized protein LOC127290193 [Leptopilina boulardi]|uniref:uncharacterized protein LOC127290193 n=1 Tax=Leptopilina boulardi TaxID=63433 RepID=UPI0021F67398|nr:uncharacterized protein LOC127290193 [Leptopilina boulardi]
MSENCTYVQKVITVPKTSIIQHQISDEIIKILIEFPDGEQKLVGFQVSDENCTIQDLLMQIGIPLDAETDISLVEDPSTLQIHYIVEVKNLKPIVAHETPSFSQEFSSPNPPPQEIEVPKFVEGKLAVCRRCGFLSSTFHRCQRCKRKLPDNVKAVIDKYTVNGSKKPCKEGENRCPVDVKPKTSTVKIEQNNGVNGTEAQEQFPDFLIKAQHTTLSCRTVRIGSYKYFPPEKIIISQYGVRLSVPSLCGSKNNVKLNIELQDIDRVLIHFGRNLPVIFLVTSPSSAEQIREILGMQQQENPYYDPLSRDLTHKRITLLPESISEDAQTFLKELFQLKLEQLSMTEANEILVRASPREPPKRFRIRRMPETGQGNN